MEKNRGYRKSFVFLLILILIPFVSALSFTDIFKDIGNLITGYDTSGILATNLTVGNQAPTVKTISSIASQTVTEDGATSVYFSFLVNDPDGRSDLNDATARANFSKTDENTRTNSSCATEANVGADANYSCKIDLWYWDGTSTWNVTAYAADNNGAASVNTTGIFSLGETTCIKMSPAALGWPSVNLGNTNTQASNFLTLNNSCNDDIASGNVRVNAVNLTGEANSNYFIRAGNFSSNVAQACEGTQLVENSAAGISSSILAAGNHSIMNNVTGQEVLFFCAETIPTNIIVQSYSTNKTGKTWTVDVI